MFRKIKLINMTTITFDSPIKLPKTHFKNIDEFIKMVSQLDFELSLQKSAKKALDIKYTDLIDIK